MANDVTINDTQLVKDAIDIADQAVAKIKPKLSPPTEGTTEDKMYYMAMWSLTWRAIQRFSALARLYEKDKSFVEVSALIGRSILEVMLNAAYMSSSERDARLQKYIDYAEYREYVYRKRLIGLVPDGSRLKVLRDDWYVDKEAKFSEARPTWPGYEEIARTVDKEAQFGDPTEKLTELLYAAAYSPLSAASHADPHCIIFSAGQTESANSIGFLPMSEQWEDKMRGALFFSISAFLQLLRITSDGMKCECSEELKAAVEKLSQARQEAKSRRDGTKRDEGNSH